MFNILGVVIWFPFIGMLARIAIAISPSGESQAAVLPRQIANANTMFNVLNTIFFIGFTGWFAKMATRLVKQKEPEKALIKPKFLDPVSIEIPAIALENVRQEVGQLGDIVRAMMVDFPPERAAVTNETLSEISQLGKKVEILEGAILEFLARIRQGDLTNEQSQTHIALMSDALHFRNIANIISNDLVDVAKAAAAGQLPTGTLKRTVLSECYKSVQQFVELAIECVRGANVEIEEKTRIINSRVKKLADDLMSQTAADLDASDPNSLRTVRLQTIFVDGLRQISSLAGRIVRNALNPETIESFDEKIGDNPNQ
jgi:phosphate:Na+ symporter